MTLPAQPPYGFWNLRGQDTVIRALEGMLSSRRLPQGLLFSGMPGCGRGLAARTLMMQANCKAESPPCGECRSCRRILLDQHPDFLRISPVNGILRIDSIRDLSERLMRRPHEARMRFVILEEAETLNRESANALLKILEEPPDGTYFILLSSHPHWLLETIRSRCQEFRFRPLSDEILAGEIAPLAPDSAAALAAARLACGDRQQGEKLARAGSRRRILARVLAENLPLPPSKAMVLAEWLAPDRENAELALDILEGLFRDICLAAMDADMLCIHGLSLDCREDLLAAGRKISAEEALGVIQNIHGARKRMEQNALPRLLLEILLLHLTQYRGSGFSLA